MDARIELRHLRYFVAVAEELHFGRAATRLHMAQPPLSQQIRRLEELLGTPLLVRSSRRVALTAAGATFLERSRRLLRQAEADVEEAVLVGRGERGRLDVGFITSSIPLGITERIRTFRERHPAVHVQLHEGFTAQILGRVLAGEIDAGIVRDIAPDPALEIQLLATEPFVAVVPAGHRLAGASAIDAADLRDEPFVFYPRAAGERAYLRNLEPCRRAGYEPRVVQEATNWVTILHLVGAGLGVTIAPRSGTLNPTASVRVAPLAGRSPATEVQLIHRAGDERALVANFLAA
jgi:DNA-binding transcriptional LysR family regulator